MNIQKRIVGEIPFDRLPPEVLTVPGDGRLQLSHRHIVGDTVKVHILDKSQGIPGGQFVDATLINTDSENGIITLLDPACKGRKVIVRYDFLLPDYGEAVTVPKNEPYQIELMNTPVKSIEGIETVQDNRFASIPLQSIKTFRDSEKIGFDREYAGKIVRVSYVGGIIRNICSGEFLDDDLKPSSTPTGMKLLKIRESYGGKHDIETGVMKVRK